MRFQDRWAILAAFGLAGYCCAAALSLFGDTLLLDVVGATDVQLLPVCGPNAAAAGS